MDPAWYSDYIRDSCLPAPENDVEGHVLGIDFDNVDGVSKQFLAASERACAARLEIKCINDVQCELSVMQACLSVCKVTHLLRAAGPWMDSEALRSHDVQLSNSVNDMFGCQLCNSSNVQTTCSMRNGGLGLRRAVDLALPAFIASRSDVRTAVFSLIDELFGDDAGELFTSSFDRGLKEAVDKLKGRLNAGHATEVDTCLAEARDRATRSDLNLPTRGF